MHSCLVEYAYPQILRSFLAVSRTPWRALLCLESDAIWADWLQEKVTLLIQLYLCIL